jgi:excisionase family DNA binding protein
MGNGTRFWTHELEKKMALENLLDPVNDSREADLAATGQRCIMAALDHSRAAHIVLESRDDAQAPRIELSPAMLRNVADLLGLMAKRQPVVLMPQKQELSTQDAANFLNVSRPHVIKLINEGELKCRQVGRHRRIEFEEMLRYQRVQKQRSADALQQLTEMSEELGLY